MAKYDFVDFSDADIRKKFQDILRQIRREAPTVECRISLQLKLPDKFDNLESLYGWEKIDKIAEGIVKDFKKVFTKGDDQTRRTLFEICNDYLKLFETQNQRVVTLETFFVEDYLDLEEYYADLKNYLNTKLERIASSEKLSKSTKEFFTGIYAQSMLNIMIEKKETEDKLLNYAKNYWSNRYIRHWLINYYRRNEQLDKAISLLEESILLDKDIPELVENYKSYAAELKELL